MIVKVQFEGHNRTYTIGISKFLAALGYDVDEADILATAQKLISTEEMKRTDEPTTHREHTE